MVSSDAQKRRYAHDSWAFNQRDPLVRKMFPTLLESPEPLPELPPAPGASAGSCRSFPDEVSLSSIIKMGGALAIDGCRLSAVGVCGLAAEKGGADGAGGGGESACGDWGAGTVRAPAQLAHPGPGSSSSSFAHSALRVPLVFFCASSGSVSVVTERIRSEGGCGLGQLLLLLSVCVGAGAMVLTQLT